MQLHASREVVVLSFSKALEPPAPDPPAPGAPPMALVVCSEAVWRGMDRVDEMVML